MDTLQYRPPSPEQVLLGCGGGVGLSGPRYGRSAAETNHNMNLVIILIVDYRIINDYDNNNNSNDNYYYCYCY